MQVMVSRRPARPLAQVGAPVGVQGWCGDGCARRVGRL